MSDGMLWGLVAFLVIAFGLIVLDWILGPKP